jgi:3-hydroxyacyl-CoA dehydrogenase
MSLPAATHLPFRTAAVLGAGVMGSQIAAHLANAGLTVHLLDIPGEDPDKNALVERAFEKLLKVRPDPFFTKSVPDRLVLGNLDDHLSRIADADWVIEAVVEDVKVKQDLMARVESVVNPSAIISTNTSGIPIHIISESRSTGFKERFLGTHFFNPPRYLQLLEVIPTADTDAAVIDRIRWFAHVHLGKGTVVPKDVPGFIGNRIGVFALLQCINCLGDYSVEEIDALTGPLLGRPRSATLRTADVVGLDTLVRIADFLHEALRHDTQRDIFRIPSVLKQLVARGDLGAKSGGGFYRKEGTEIHAIDPETLAYGPPGEMALEALPELTKIKNLSERLRALYKAPGRSGDFFRRHLLQVLSYCLHSVPEITDDTEDIDRAMRWGFGWEVGPFEMWSTIGYHTVLKDLKELDQPLPTWVEEMETGETEPENIGQVGKPQDDDEHQGGSSRTSDTRSPADVRAIEGTELWRNEEAVLLDMGEQVALFEYRSKANSMGETLVSGIVEAVDFVEQNDFRGMVICNEGKNYSVGANLQEMLNYAQQDRLDLVDKLIRNFQGMIQRVHYAAKPVVVALHGRALGGGCELTLACTHPVAAAETYIGLVELAVGLIPAGCGTMRMAALSHERAPSDDDAHIEPFLTRAFETIATAKVSNSAHEAVELGFLPLGTPIAMNIDRRLYVAKEEVLRLSNQGYSPPHERNAIKVLGRPIYDKLAASAEDLLASGSISEYDCHLTTRLAHVITGGDIPGSTYVHENHLIDLEREVFVSLTGETKTQDRINSILTTNKPLRN